MRIRKKSPKPSAKRPPLYFLGYRGTAPTTEEVTLLYEREYGAPAQPATFAEPFRGDLHAARSDGHGMGDAFDEDLALQDLVEREWHRLGTAVLVRRF